MGVWRSSAPDSGLEPGSEAGRLGAWATPRARCEKALHAKGKR